MGSKTLDMTFSGIIGGIIGIYFSILVNLEPEKLGNITLYVGILIVSLTIWYVIIDRRFTNDID